MALRCLHHHYSPGCSAAAEWFFEAIPGWACDKVSAYRATAQGRIIILMHDAADNGCLSNNSRYLLRHKHMMFNSRSILQVNDDCSIDKNKLPPLAFANSLREETKSQLCSGGVFEFDRNKLLNLGHGEFAS